MASSPLISTASPHRKVLAARHLLAAALCAGLAIAAAAAHARTLDPRSQQAIEAALAALRGADLIVVDDPVPGRAPSALLATRAAASPAALAATLGDPRAYSDAIPSLVRADVVDRRPSASGAGIDQLINWELEIPLFNLRGKAWVRPRADGVDLVLAEGDLAPGQLAFTWIPASSDTGATLVLESQVNMRSAGWIFRRVAARSPFGEGAMNVTAAYVVLRAAVERALHPADPHARRPRGTRTPPAPAALIADASVLASSPALDAFRARGAVAAVRRARDGHLAAVSVAVPIALDADPLAARLTAPESWRAFPGWHRAKALAGDRIAIDDNLPLVDFDAVWQLTRDRARGFTATVADGATRGAMFAWDVAPASTGSAGGAHRSVAVLSLYPRLETSGYVPRKFIAAEPLLEHGMALAVGYADAMSMARALATTR
jgi:hypothetical protein